MRQANPSIMKKGSSWLFAIALILSLLSSVLASPILVPRQDDNPDGTVVVPNSAASDDYQLTVHGIILAFFLFIFGLIFLFFGFRHFRLTSFLVGFYVFANITWIILANAEPQATYGSNRLTIYLVVALLVGIIAGLFLACCFHLGIWLLGAFGGYVIGLWILAWGSGGVIQQYWGQGLFLALMAIAGLIFAIFFELIAVIIFTSFIGAYSIILGLDIFLNTGFSKSAIFVLIAKHNILYETNARVFGMLAGVFALALVGMVVQYLQARRIQRESWNGRYGYAWNRRNNRRVVEPNVVEPKRTKRWGLF